MSFLHKYVYIYMKIPNIHSTSTVIYMMKHRNFVSVMIFLSEQNKKLSFSGNMYILCMDI